jgi:type II secretory pathway pseudopilin PulG
VIAILITMVIPVMQGIRERAEEAGCMTNLRSLHVAAELHVQQQQQWPQVNPKLINADSEEYARQWIAALAPYGPAAPNWRCPSIERAMSRGTDKKEIEKDRVDYMATAFDSRQATPRKWARQPWFIERGDVHGRGNLMIFPDGSIAALNDMIQKVK